MDIGLLENNSPPWFPHLVHISTKISSGPRTKREENISGCLSFKKGRLHESLFFSFIFFTHLFLNSVGWIVFIGIDVHVGPCALDESISIPH